MSNAQNGGLVVNTRCYARNYPWALNPKKGSTIGCIAGGARYILAGSPLRQSSRLNLY